MDQVFVLCDLGKIPSRERCRETVEEIARIRLANDGIRLRHDKNGKPYLERSGYHVSYSHADGLLFMALSKYSVGVDFESENRGDELKDVTRYAFSSGDSIPNNDLLGLWCLKEASLKKKGIGFLLANPNEYTLNTDIQHYEMRKNGELVDYGFYRIVRKWGYVLAICSTSIINSREIIREDYRNVYFGV